MGQLISQTGSWMQRLAQAWLVLDLTGSPVALGTVTALQFLPVLALSLLGGVLADRWSKRTFLLVTQGLQMVQAFVLGGLVVMGLVQLWHVYLLAALLGVTVALDQPARRSLPALLVAREHLVSAVALNSTLFNAARVVGPALGGVALAAIGAGGSFLLNGVSFLAVLAALALMRPSEFYGGEARGQGGVARQLGEVVRYAWRTPDIALILLVLAVLGTFGYNFNVVLPLLARYSLDSGALGFGGMNAALGLGSVVGSLLVAGQGGSSLHLMLGAGMGFGVLLALVALAPTYQVALAALFLVGMAGVVFSTTANTNLQLLSPDHLHGRLMSLYSVLFTGTTPLGSALTGVIAEHWDARAALLLNSFLCVAGVLAGMAYMRSRLSQSAS